MEEQDLPSEGDSQDIATQRPATFKGLLDLSGFEYKSPEMEGGLRRSARNKPAGAATSELVTSSTNSGSPSELQLSEPSSVAGGRKRKTSASTAAALESASASSSSPTKKKTKRGKSSSGYAPPSTYAHLSLLPDAVGPDLLVFFVGLNPGIETARSGHAYAHKSNLFWKLLFWSGVTPRPCQPEEDGSMPALFHLGLTNIVGRPSRNGAELSKGEMDDGVAMLEAKARQWRPESMCIVGKSIWESIWRVRHGGVAVGKAFRYGWQDESENLGAIEGEWAGAKVFVATTTSGLAASMSLAEKKAVWEQLGSWVKQRRVERAAAKAKDGDAEDEDGGDGEGEGEGAGAGEADGGVEENEAS